MTVLTVEEHASVLTEWWRRQVRARTLVCLDAHLDLQFVSPEYGPESAPSVSIRLRHYSNSS